MKVYYDLWPILHTIKDIKLLKTYCNIYRNYIVNSRLSVQNYNYVQYCLLMRVVVYDQDLKFD